MSGAVWTSLDFGASPALSSDSETDDKLLLLLLLRGVQTGIEYNAYISQPSVHNDMDLDQHEYARL